MCHLFYTLYREVIFSIYNDFSLEVLQNFEKNINLFTHVNYLTYSNGPETKPICIKHTLEVEILTISDLSPFIESVCNTLHEKIIKNNDDVYINISLSFSFNRNLFE